uniref:Uncharacterized protein n=1 Tax=Anguilla anguilla TaxID=7936 RepID=A0A0E9XBS0_ANGAN
MLNDSCFVQWNPALLPVVINDITGMSCSSIIAGRRFDSLVGHCCCTLEQGT